MKYFVTGATGHIGNVLVKYLYQAGHSVSALVLPNDPHASLIEPYARIYYGNILNQERLDQWIVGYDCVIHLAGIVEIGTGKKKKIYQVNVAGTKHVLQACQKNCIPKLIYTSSVHAFEEAPHGEMMSEPIRFDEKKVKSHYAKSKAIASEMILHQTSKTLKTIILCPSGIIGPYDYHLSNTGQLFIDVLLGRLTAYVKGSYNFVDVRDVVKGIISASTKSNPKSVYLLSGHNITVKELLDMISNITGIKKINTRLARWFILMMSYFAELYYKIRKQKALFTHYSIKVLGSNHQFSNALAIEDLAFKVRPIEETVKDTLSFAKEHYLVRAKKGWKRKSF